MDGSQTMDLTEESLENQTPTDQNEGIQEEGDSQLSDHAAGRSKKKDPYQLKFEAFLKEYEDLSDNEAKLEKAIVFMESTLGQGGTPHFRYFWEVRRLCLPLFKENISPSLRARMWGKYSELSKEARRLKDILDEQSSFAAEQIELAVSMMEKELSDAENQIKKSTTLEKSYFPHALKDHIELYQDLQRELNLFNVQASRINALRKELLKTDMRIKQKNKFFQRLSAAGDQVFPRRKELIKKVSQQFEEDVERFIKANFSDETTADTMLYELREEIKTLQGLAKILTLNTNSFTHTRMQLSECWDKLKNKEKERKKERAQQKVAFKQNAELISQRIHTLKEAFEKGELSLHEAQKSIDEVVTEMRNVELGREELKVLREELGIVRKLHQDKSKTEEEVKVQKEEERNQKKKARYKSLKERSENLVSKHSEYDLDAFMAERETLIAEIHEAQLTKSEKFELERNLKQLKDLLADKKEKALMVLSDDDRQALEQLQEVLKQRKIRRQEIKQQLDAHRRSAGSSGLDFEKAMNFQTMMSEEKERLDKINQAIEEIEEKISELQSNSG